VIFEQGTITITLDTINVITGYTITDYQPFYGYFGFSAATGFEYQEQRVDNIQVEAEYIVPSTLDGHVYDSDTMAPLEGVTVTGERLGGITWNDDTTQLAMARR
jgi:hypothetical protein